MLHTPVHYYVLYNAAGSPPGLKIKGVSPNSGDINCPIIQNARPASMPKGHLRPCRPCRTRTLMNWVTQSHAGTPYEHPYILTHRRYNTSMDCQLADATWNDNPDAPSFLLYHPSQGQFSTETTCPSKRTDPAEGSSWVHSWRETIPFFQTSARDGWPPPPSSLLLQLCKNLPCFAPRGTNPRPLFGSASNATPGLSC